MFRLLAENVLDYAIFIVDPHRHVLSWSKGAERLLGLHRGGDRRPAVRLLLHPRGRASGRPAEGTGRRPSPPAGATTTAGTCGRTAPGSGPAGPSRRSGTRAARLRGLRQDHAGPHRAEAGRGGGPRAGAATAPADRPRPGPDRPLRRRPPLQVRQQALRRPVRPAPPGGRRQAHPRRAGRAGVRRHRAARGRRPGRRAGRVRGRGPLRRAGAAGHAVCLRPGVRRRRAGSGGSSRPSSTSPRRRRAEAALAASRRRLQALFDTTLDAILLADDQARYVDANPAACTLLGYDREELLRRGGVRRHPAAERRGGPGRVGGLRPRRPAGRRVRPRPQGRLDRRGGVPGGRQRPARPAPVGPAGRDRAAAGRGGRCGRARGGSAA